MAILGNSKSFISKKCISSGVAPDIQTKSNILNDKFSSVFNKTEIKTYIKDTGHSTHYIIRKTNITPICIEKPLRDLQSHTATGPDQLPTLLLKELAAELTHITRCFQASDSDTIPEDWKIANYVQFFKKGEQNTPANYRYMQTVSIISDTALSWNNYTQQNSQPDHQLTFYSGWSKLMTK